MADEKTRRRRAARVKVARFQGYKDFYLARKFGITQEQARTIIRRIGKDRVKLIAAAKRLKNRNRRRALKSATTAEEPASRSYGG
jgi:hypothetical protein